MPRFLVASTIIAAVSAAAIAMPDHGGTAARGDGAETDAAPAPAVAEWLRDTIRSAQRDADEMAAIAREDGIPIALVRHEIAHRVLFQSPEIISILREDRAFGDAGDGSLWLIPLNWDARADALIPIQAVLGDPAGRRAAYARVAALLRGATLGQARGGDRQGRGAAIDAAIRPDPMYLSTFTFVPSTVPDRIGGIAWHFEPSVVAPAAEGIVSVVIAQEDLRALVAPEWRALFAGEPAGGLAPGYVSPGNERLQNVGARY